MPVRESDGQVVGWREEEDQKGVRGQRSDSVFSWRHDSCVGVEKER